MVKTCPCRRWLSLVPLTSRIIRGLAIRMGIPKEKRRRDRRSARGFAILMTRMAERPLSLSAPSSEPRCSRNHARMPRIGLPSQRRSLRPKGSINSRAGSTPRR
jgi:hypothetical protein